MTNKMKVTISGLDMVELLDFIVSKSKKYQAMMLSDIEEILDKDSPEYFQIRKIVLDYTNKYERGVSRLITGNVEDDSNTYFQ